MDTKDYNDRNFGAQQEYTTNPHPEKLDNLIEAEPEFKRYAISVEAQELFMDEKGLMMSVGQLAELRSRKNKAAWDKVFAEYPELKGQMAVYDEEKDDIFVVPEGALSITNAKAGLAADLEVSE